MMSVSTNSITVDALNLIIANQAREHSGAAFLIDVSDGRVVSYGDLNVSVEMWNGVLTSESQRRFERVGIAIADPLTFVTTFVSLLALGVWVAPLDPSLVSSARDEVMRRRDSLRLELVIGPPREDMAISDGWLEVPRFDEDSQRVALSTVSNASGGVILSSSGTTGTPKVIALSQEHLLRAATLIAGHNRLSPESRGFNPLPLWHINAEVVAVLASLVAGSSLVVADRFHRTDFWSLMETFEVTWVNAVPAIVSRLTTLRDGEFVPSRIEFIRSASAPLSPLVLASFEEATNIPVIETYGMTEAASQICANPLNGPRKPGSVGRPVGVDIRIVDGNPSNDHGGAVVGHVEIRGPSVIEGYESSGLEDRFSSDGWLRTGDVGFFDGDGYLYLVGRSDDVINRSGEKIYPREIEEVVIAMDEVRHVAVVGRPDEVYGEVPVLYVELRDQFVNSVEPSVHTIHLRLAEHFSRDRRPSEIIVVERMPTHATGKVQKRNLERPDIKVLFRWSWT